jgi:LmbE family N-acetylglucosaminyl deacetylase
MPCSQAPAIIIAPHPDDETFGCGGLIALKRLMRVDVTILFLTDGRCAAREPGVTEADLIRTRQREGFAAADVLDVPQNRVHFFGLPDTQLRDLPADRRQLACKSIAEIIDSHPGAEIYVTHRHDIHPDHEAAWQLVADSIAHSSPVQPPERFEYSIWMSWLAKATRSLRAADLAGARRLDIRSVRAKKRSAIAAYQSQVKALPPGFISRFDSPFELFFRSSAAPAAGSRRVLVSTATP